MKHRISVSVILLLLMVFLTACGDIKMKKSSDELLGADYESVIKELQEMGFKKITQDEVADLTSAGPMKDGTVESVSINGETSFDADAKFPKDSEVVVKYHIIKKIGAPIGSDDIEDKDYMVLADLFTKAGFTNVQTKELYDIDPKTEEKDHIAEIVINNSSSFNKDDPIPFDAEIVVNCHLFFKEYKLNLKVDFVPNLIFNKSDVNFFIGDEKVATLEHGKDWSGELSLKQGTYKLLFESVDDSSVNANTELEVNCDIEAEYKLSILFSGMEIEEVYIDRKVELTENQAKITCTESEFRNRDHKEVYDEIKELGFTNIVETPVYDAYSDSEIGKVTDVKINGIDDYKRGDIFDSNAEVVISYYLMYKDDPEWIAEQKRIEEEKKRAEEQKAQEKADASNTNGNEGQDSSNNGAPVMAGSNIDVVISEAEEYGLKRVFDDADYEYGQKKCQLSNSNGGLTLDIFYLKESKELLCASIRTTNAASSDEQYEFIEAMSGVLCPKSSSDSVKSWVESNIGDTANTVIDEIDYTLSFGPSDNALYDVGQNSWEKWELSH